MALNFPPGHAPSSPSRALPTRRPEPETHHLIIAPELAFLTSWQRETSGELTLSVGVRLVGKDRGCREYDVYVVRVGCRSVVLERGYFAGGK